MNKEVDYYYSHVSPWSYLGAKRLYEIAAVANAKINFKPINLGVIFPQSGGLPLGKRAPQRRTYRMMELKRPVLRRSTVILFAKNLVLQSERGDLLRQM